MDDPKGIIQIIIHFRTKIIEINKEHTSTIEHIDDIGIEVAIVKGRGGGVSERGLDQGGK